MNEICFINNEGDVKVRWDSSNKKDTEAARSFFDEQVKVQKAAAFVYYKNGKQGKRLYEFDPEAPGIVIVPALSGG